MYIFVFAVALLFGEPPDTPPDTGTYTLPAAVICTSIEDLKSLNSMPIPKGVTNIEGLVEAGKTLGYNCKFAVAIRARNIRKVEDQWGAVLPIKQRSGKVGYFYEITVIEENFPVRYFLIGDAGTG